MEWIRSVEEDPSKVAIFIVAVSAVAAYFMMSYYERQCDPLRDEFAEAVKQYKKPSQLYKFLMSIEKEKSEKYFNLRTHLLNVKDGPPANVCVNQMLRIS